MSDAATQSEPVQAPPKRKGGRPKKAKPVEPIAPAAPQVPTGEFTGMTTTKCPDACFIDGRCIISTVNVCKHPCMSADSGCGPITMANRARSLTWLKQQGADKG